MVFTRTHTSEKNAHGATRPRTEQNFHPVKNVEDAPVLAGTARRTHVLREARHVGVDGGAVSSLNGSTSHDDHWSPRRVQCLSTETIQQSQQHTTYQVMQPKQLQILSTARTSQNGCFPLDSSSSRLALLPKCS